MRIFDRLRAPLAVLGLALMANGAAGGEAVVQTGANLPGGASALRETHGDWTVACKTGGAGEKNETDARRLLKSCVLSQERVNPRRQRTIAINLVPQGEGAQGAIILPFGLAVTQGVALTVEGAALGEVRPFSTCLQVGCIVPLTLDAGELVRLGAGKELTVVARTLSGQAVPLPVSLNGIQNAIERTRALLD